MSNPNRRQLGEDHGGAHPPHGPALKRMHRSPFFWVAAVCILLAMTIYVMTNNLAVAPADVREPVPASGP